MDIDEKEAKKSSAQRLLFKLKNKLENVNQTTRESGENSINNTRSVGQNTNSTGLNTGHVSPKVNNEVNSNPIGHLQELCAQKSYSTLKYKSIKMGYDHSPNFVTKCKLIFDGNEAVGEGKVSKKAAA